MRQTSSLAVELDSDVVVQDCNPFAAPTELSGRAVLRLAEATAIDDITVTFSGVASSHAHWTDCPASFHIICEHTVTLFKRDVRQPASRHYFCPGRHDFAFSICLGDSLPASTSTTSADVHYELSAYAAFQGPSKNSGLRKKAPVTLIRSLPSDSLLFQQSLDVESSRDLVHATVSMPHQAWAAGETLACSLQTLTLDKGLQCTNMKLSIVQTEHIHEVIGQDDRSRVLSRIQHDLRTKTPRPSLALIQRRLGIDRPCHRSQNQTPGQRSSVMLSIPIPPNTQSSQSIAPIIISHRLECALTAVDGGGRLSEIIFSLPLHILDARLRIHVASATHYARAAFHGFCGVSEDFLPSYHAHVQDRVPSCSNLREGCTSNTPTYEASAMHFIGGLPPLDSLRELPRYSATS